jgi:hypothetical protein
LAQETQELGTAAGSGEGVSPTWALPGLDFFEGLMSLQTYADPRLKVPSGGYETDLGNSYDSEAAVILDEKRRIPLYQLAFLRHDADVVYQPAPLGEPQGRLRGELPRDCFHPFPDRLCQNDWLLPADSGSYGAIDRLGHGG